MTTKSGESEGGKEDRAATEPRTACAVRVSGITKSYGKTRALNGVNLTARHGEIHAIIGENGSGKSTLVKILSGLLRPDEGEVQVLGHDTRKLGPRRVRRLGVETVFQDVLVVDSASILDNVYIGQDPVWRPVGGTKRRERITECRNLLTRLVGRPVDPAREVGEVPLAVKQWVTIARALIRQPRVLILDESTAALDAGASATLDRELGRLKSDGVCILLITHRIAELKSFADRATVLRDGATAAELDCDEITAGRILQEMTGQRAERSTMRTSAVRAGGEQVALRASGVRIGPADKAFSIELYEGEILGLAGLEGHGQDEFLDILAARIRPTNGEIDVPDVGHRRLRTPSDAARTGIAYVPGDRKKEGIFPHQSILANFGIATYGDYSRLSLINNRAISAALAHESARLKIRMAGSAAKISSLSGGNQQKIVLARWLAAAPKILLLNDATRGVDIETKHDIYELLRTLTLEGCSVVMLSSELDELVAVCDRVVVFRVNTVHKTMDAGELDADSLLSNMFGAGEVSIIADAMGE